MKTKARAKKTKQSKKLTLKDRLSRLTYYRACQALGARRAAIDPPRGRPTTTSTSTATSTSAATCSG